MGEVKKICLCGAKNCSGFIGKKVQKLKKVSLSTSNGIGPGRKKLKVKKKVEEKAIKVWDDLCFRCWTTGEVLMCDYKTCPKVYHLACLGREKMPREKWYCPWHHCVECGKVAVSHCPHCPNAYCKSHGNVLKDHTELGKICDEHKDDLKDLIKYYRKTGGIKELLPNPNVPNNCVVPPKPAAIKETSVIEQQPINNDEGPRPEKRPGPGRPRNTATSSNKENSEKAATSRPPPANSYMQNPFMYKCIVKGCDFKNRRNRLKQHYINAHQMTDQEADQNVPQKLTMANLKKIECALCKKSCIPAMLRRHLYHSHNDLSKEEANQIFEKAVRKHSKLNMNDDVTELNLESNPLYSKVEPDGRIKCKAPDCEMMVSAQNIARHWHQYHPKLRKDDYQPSLQKLLKILREGSDTPLPTTPTSTSTPLNSEKSPRIGLRKSVTPTEKQRSCGHTGCDFRSPSLVKMAEHRKSLGHNTSSLISTPTKSCSSANVSPKSKLLCGFKDCDFITKYMSNLSRHRKRRNHYLTDNDKIQAEAEEKRDEIAKKIEQTLSEDNITDDDEVDVTIPLSKHLSPSKITDYFKPVPKKVKPMQSLDCNDHDASNNKNSENNVETVPKESNHKNKPVLEQ